MFNPTLVLLLLLGWMSIPKGLAASCCGGGQSSLPWIISDEQYRLSVTQRYQSGVLQADSQGNYFLQRPEVKDNRWENELQFSAKWSDRWQAVLRFPLVYRSLETSAFIGEAFGVGDVIVGGAYEAVPEYRYHPWRPKIFLFGGAVLPISRSVYNSQSEIAVDAISQGAYRLFFGALASKQWSRWRAMGQLEMGGGTLKDAPVAQRAQPTFFSFAGDWSIFYLLQDIPLSLGASLFHTYQSGIDSVTNADSLSWTLSLQASYEISAYSSVFLAYGDQTLMGPARNSNLSRIVSLGFQWKWFR